MTDPSQYLDLGTLAHVAEPLVEPIESSDFTTFKTMTPGWYLSRARKITGKQRPDGQFSFTIVFEGGVENVETGRVYADRFPLKTWRSSTPFQTKDREGNVIPGKTSQIAEYLRYCGLTPKTIGTSDELIAMVNESQAIPVRVFVSRTDRREKTENPDGTVVYSSIGLKLQDFNTGTKEAPVWAEVVERDGKTYKANAVVNSFGKA